MPKDETTTTADGELQALAELHRSGATMFQDAIGQLAIVTGRLTSIVQAVLDANRPPDERTLDERMAAVQAELEDVPRRGHAEIRGKTKAGADYTYSYDYILEADLMAGIRPLLARHGIATYYSDEIVTNQSGTATVRVAITFSAAGEERIIRGEAVGIDTGDKGPNKAKTSAVRYLLWKTFLQPSDEDPEQEHVTSEQAAGAHAGREAAQGRQAAARRPSARETGAGGRGAGESKGRLIQRITTLAVELDEVQGRRPGYTQGKLYDDVQLATELALPDLDPPALVAIGQALAGHVAEQRRLAEQGDQAVADFVLPPA